MVLKLKVEIGFLKGWDITGGFNIRNDQLFRRDLSCQLIEIDNFIDLLLFLGDFSGLSLYISLDGLPLILTNPDILIANVLYLVLFD